MDKTLEFTTQVALVKKNLQIKTTNILPPVTKSPLIVQANTLNRNLYNLKQFLLEARHYYLGLPGDTIITVSFPMNPKDIQWMSPQQKDELDIELSRLLKEFYSQIQSLELFPKSNLRNSIIIILEERLADASAKFRKLQETRQKRRFKPLKSTPTIPERKLELSKEQEQMLEMENQHLLDELQGTLGLVETAAKSILEIADMQNTLSRHLSSQTEAIEFLYQDAVQATERINKGNEYLVNAKKYMGNPRYWFFYFLLMASFLLLVLDAYYS